MRPDVLVLDEPTSGSTGRPPRAAELLATLDQTQVIVTHDLPFAFATCPRALVLDGGRFVVDRPTRGCCTTRRRSGDIDSSYRSVSRPRMSSSTAALAKSPVCAYTRSDDDHVVRLGDPVRVGGGGRCPWSAGAADPGSGPPASSSLTRRARSQPVSIANSAAMFARARCSQSSSSRSSENSRGCAASRRSTSARPVRQSRSLTWWYSRRTART